MTLNPFERIRTTDGKIFLLLLGLALLFFAFDVIRTLTNGGTTLLVVELIAVWVYIVVGTYGTIKIVARPVRRAVEHFRRISAGDYSKPVLTRRVDEFGDMLRALDGMRLSLSEAVRARETAERKHREIVERSAQGFYQTTEAGDILAANDALAHMLGYENAAELIAEPPGITKRLHIDPKRRETWFQQLHSRGVVKGFEAKLRRRDGRVIWVSQSARLVKDGQGKVLYCEGFLDDITERKEAEQLKADFVSFVTHQLRTPLSGIRWMLELASQAEPNEEVASYIADAHASAQRLISLVNDLLDIARLESGRLETHPAPVDLRDLTQQLVAELSPLAAAKQQKVSVSDGNVPDILADPQLVRQAVLNLLSNAIKYTPDGGRISVAMTLDDGHLRWAVRDSGIGISKAAQRRLFEKFYRAENAQVIDTEGTGLGLYLVRLIAERSGGSVHCESVEGEGSTFTLTFPLAGEQRAIA